MNFPFYFFVAFFGLLSAGQSSLLDSDGNDLNDLDNDNLRDAFFHDFVPRYKRDNEDQYMQTLAGINCG